MNELEKICIYDPAGANYLLGKDWEFPITDKCERSAKIMGDDFVRLVFESTHKVVFDAFSFIRYNGQTFFLREKYIPKPKGTFKEDSGEVSTAYFSYDVKFVSVANMLDKYVCYRHVKVSGDNGGEWNEPEININGNLETMYKIIMGSIQQVAERLSDHMEFTSMLKTIPANGLNSDGTINTSKVKLTAGTKLLTFNFSGDKIANVCTTVANNFTNDDKKDTEWYITEDNGSLTLHFAKYVDEEYGVQYVSDYISNNNGADSFAHPQKSGGLKDVDYAQEWSGITNVIVPYGSTRNMTYQAAKGIDEVTQMQSTFGKRLRLKPNTYYYVKDKDGKDVSFLTDKQGAVRNSSVDTGIEEVRFYDEIYPQGHFKVTNVETKNKRQDGEIVPEYTVAGVAIDSSGNEIQPAEGFYPIAIEEGTTLSVRFEKGLLNGREFEIANKTRKDEGRTTYSLKFTIVADGSLEDGTLIPSGNFIPREGDEFALFNMKMPEVYITAAEHELAQRVYSDLEEAVSKRPEVKCTTDPTSWDKEMALGYQFQVKSEKFNSDDTFVSRVISYSYKLTKPKEIQFNLASAIMQGTLSHMNDLIVDVTNQAGGLEQRAINLSRRGWRDAAEMAEMVDSLAADMMLVGNEKYQFAFTAGIEIVNSNNQTTAIKIGEGTLQHTQDPYISDYTCQGWWSHGAVTLNNGHTENGSASLVSLPDTPFYLYAVVGQNSDNISFELQDKEQDGEAYLLLGILSSAFMDTIGGITTNYRVFNRTNGYTQISGGTITTEQIQDAGRNLIIDFQSKRIIARNGAVIIGNIKFKASDEMTAEEQLAALGIDVDAAAKAAEDAKKQAEEEAAAIRQEYADAIAESEDKIGEELAKKVTEINGGIEALQKQVDGEVSSYFYPYSPIGNDESVRMDVEPMSEWLQNYSLTNGVYVLKDGAINELINNIGDTFTNTEIFESEDLTPLAGKSWRWCDATNTPSIEKYIVVQYEKDGIAKTMKLHWHIITDIDAIRALEAAKNAQATADGKTTTFVGDKDPTNYGIGDLWILAADRTLNRTDYKQGTILTANEKSATFDEEHWSEKIRYTDDTIAQKAVDDAKKADDKAVDAQTSAKKANDQLNAISDDEKIAVTEFAALETQLETIQAEYNDIIVDAEKYKITKTNYESAYDNAVTALKYHGGMAYSGTTKAPVNNDKSITIVTDTSKKYAYGNINAYYTARQTILEAISDAADKVAENFAKEYSLEAIANMEIGGRNLLKNTEFMDSWEPIKYDGSTITKTTEGISLMGKRGTKISTDGGSSRYKVYYDLVDANEIDSDKQYTLSFNVKADGYSLCIRCKLSNEKGGNTFNNEIIIPANTSKRVTFTGYPFPEANLQLWFGAAHYDSENNATTEYDARFIINELKLECGNKATDWTPAPEDVEAEIVDAKNDAAAAQATANAAKDKLESWSADGVITHFEVQGIKDELASIKADYDEINADYTKYSLGTPTDFNGKYDTYKGQLDTLSGATANTPVKIPANFTTNQTNYYEARTEAYNNISTGVNNYAENIATQQVQQALDGLELGGENLVLKSKGDSNKNIRANNESDSAEFQYSCTPTHDDTYGDELKIGLTCSTQGKYVPDSYSYTTCIWVQCKKETIKGKKYTISFDARLLPSSSADNCTVYFRAAGTGYSTTQMGKVVIDKTKKRYSITVDSNAESDTNTYSYFTLFLSRTTTIYISNVKVEQGNKATGWSPAPEDVDSKAEAIQKIANEAKESAIESNAQLANMSNDSILTPQEKGSVANEWACIQEEYLQNESNKESVWGNATVTEWTAYNTAYTKLQTYVGTLALTDRANNTEIDKSTFQTNFANYYSANVAFLNALSKKVAELEVATMEIGGRNLLRNSAIVTHAAGATNNYSYKVLTPTVGLQPNTNYVFSVDKSEMTAGSDTAFTVYIIDSSMNNRRNGFTIPISNERQSVSFKTMPSVTDTDVVLVYAGKQGTTAGKAIKLTNIKLEKGTKATDWTPAPEDVDDAIAAVDSKAQALEFLKTALEDGSTEIAGGLTMTNVLMLKNLDDDVTAGMSGLTTYKNKEDKVLMWGGCTYEEAYAAANNDDYNTGRGTITTLLKKDGTGKIGIFKISETQAVVKTNQGEVLIDASTDSGGIFIRNSKGENKISIKNGPLGSDFIPEEYSDSGKKSFSFSNVLCSGSSGTCSTQRSAYLWENMVETLSNGTNTVTVSFKNMSFRQMLRYMGATPTGNTTAKIRLYAQYGGGGYFPAATKTLTLQNVTSGSNYVSELTYQSFSLTHTSTSAYKYYLSVEVNGQQHYACLGDFMMQGDVEWSWHYVENSIPQTIIGTDGFATIYDNKKFFIVKNTENGQKIYAKGLSNGADREAGSGELYVTSSFVDAFVSFLDEFYSYVDHVRTIGSNAGNADAMQTKIKGIKNTLVDASGNRITDIIASS